MGNSPKYSPSPAVVENLKCDIKAVRVCYRVALAKVVPLYNI